MEQNKGADEQKKLAKQLEIELEQEYKKEKEKRRYKEDEQEAKSLKKKFTIFQSILLLTVTLFLSTGGGFALGHFYFWDNAETKRINEQLEYYQERVRINPASLEDRIVLGYTYYLKGDTNRAVSEFNYVLDQDENYYGAYYNLGLVYVMEKKYYEALSMFNKTIQLAPRDYKGYAQAGAVYRYLDMYEEALEALDEANQLNPASASVIYEIGLVVEAMGDYEGALEIYRDALAYDPLFVEAAEALERLQENDLINVGETNE